LNIFLDIARVFQVNTELTLNPWNISVSKAFVLLRLDLKRSRRRLIMLSVIHNTALKTLTIAGAALSLAACGSSGSYRVASVGSVPADTGSTGQGGSDGSSAGSGDGATGGGGSGSGTGSGSGGTMTTAGIPVVGKVLVTAGNTVIGVSGKHNALAERINGLAPGATNITGTVTTVLRKTGQTLVDLGQGQSLILASARGKLGEVVKIDLLSKTVVAANAGSSLIGVSVLSPTVATGTLAAVNLANNGPVLTVGGGSSASGALNAVNGAIAPVNGVLAPVTGALTPVTTAVLGSSAGSGTAPITGKVGAVVGGLVGGLKGPK
jgi:hypothetical protein